MYVDTAIASNIQHSLRFADDGRYFGKLHELYEAGELTNAINRIIEDMNHRFLVEVVTNNRRSLDIVHRCYQDETPYETAIRYLATGIAECAWSPDMKRVIEHYRRYGNRELIGGGAQMKELRGYIERIAAHPEAHVLILGESGTGKETVAAQIHNRSPRRNEPFYAFNCASVNPELLESRFFGHEKGAFTGANEQRQGLFELADGGTLFLDEIGELPLEAQGTLLRVLEGGRFMRLGGKDEIKTDVRLVTATNRNLSRMVREGKFREDLFMRLNVVQIRVPPLREHKEDIRDIADIWWFEKFRKHLTEEQIAALGEYDYPGNLSRASAALKISRNTLRKHVSES